MTLILKAFLHSFIKDKTGFSISIFYAFLIGKFKKYAKKTEHEFDDKAVEILDSIVGAYLQKKFVGLNDEKIKKISNYINGKGGILRDVEILYSTKNKSIDLVIANDLKKTFKV